MTKLNNIILCLLGKSGCGKTTIAERLHTAYGFEVLSSYTTRKPRYNGEEGHIFIDKQTFDELPNKVAYTNFNGNEYCVTKEQVDNADVYIIDVAGLKKLKELYNDKEIVAFYIDVTMETCLERMRERGDSEDVCWSRLRHDEEVFRGVHGLVDYAVNGIPNDTWLQIVSIINSHLMHKSRFRYGKE